MKELVKNIIEKYNRYRYPEIEANLLKMNEKEIVVEFFGYLCKSCGLYDHFEDLKYMLEEEGIKSEINEIKDIVVEENGKINIIYIVKYKIL